MRNWGKVAMNKGWFIYCFFFILGLTSMTFSWHLADDNFTLAVIIIFIGVSFAFISFFAYGYWELDKKRDGKG